MLRKTALALVTIIATACGTDRATHIPQAGDHEFVWLAGNQFDFYDGKVVDEAVAKVSKFFDASLQ